MQTTAAPNNTQQLNAKVKIYFSNYTRRDILWHSLDLIFFEKPGKSEIKVTELW